MEKRKKPLVGVSGCLLGEEIRYDGKDKKSTHVIDDLFNCFEYVSFCPEVSMGLGIPRPPIELVEKNDEIHLVDVEDHNLDHTALAKDTFNEMAPHFKDVSGLIFTKGSPSCGHDPVKYQNEAGELGLTKGLWADHLEKCYPSIPKIDSGRLTNDHLKETFLSQVLSYFNFNLLEKSPKFLIKFHEQHKFYILQYGSSDLKALGQSCAGITPQNFKQKYLDYSEILFQKTFKGPITTKKRVNVLEHMAGFFKKEISQKDKKDLQKSILSFKNKKISFEKVLILLWSLTKSYGQPYLKNQKIFSYYLKN